MNKPRLFAATALALVLLQSVAVQAQDSAATDGTVLPRPDQPFTGQIGQTYADSTPAFPKPVTAPPNAPNIFMILGDDIGFAAASTFGGPVPTPNLDRLAARGLVYNRFHTTAMCSPTRASLLTGRNHHAVGNGIVANLSTGYPGYNNVMPRSAATIAEVLKQNGYNTAMFGKHHNAPEAHVSAAGPFDMWPTGLGFEHFWGFMGAETNQFTPALYNGTTPIPTLAEGGPNTNPVPDPNLVLDRALADQTINWIHNQQAAAPDKPFFAYLATGSAHAPLQAPADWIARFKGQFDEGYDVMQARIVERQKKMGIIPANTRATPRPDGIPAWKDLSPARKKINARFMEVYAAMLAYQDNQIGRILDELDRMGEADNTLVVWITGDNGAAPEGGADGSLNPMAGFANNLQESEETLLANLDKVGGRDAVANWGYGWVWATNAPMPYGKQMASHLGGTRNGMVISWPERIKARGIRSQFGHVTDIVPTILEATGLPAPKTVNGIAQQPIDGVSLAYTFDAPKAPERHTTQYFEMMGNRAIYHDGWLASTTPVNAPWKPIRGVALPTDYKWELYDLRSDFGQTRDLAAKNPSKLNEMKALFDKEARRNNVFPLDDRMKMERFLAASSLVPQRDHYTYWGAGISTPVLLGAPLLNRSFRVTAEVDLADATQSAPVVAAGSNFAGWSFYLDEGRPTAIVAASHYAKDQHIVASPVALRPGKTILVFDFRYDGEVNAGGEMIVSANGTELARGRMPATFSKYVEMTDTLDIGFDADTPVTTAYPLGSRLSGSIARVDISVGKVGRKDAAPAMPSPAGKNP